MPIIQLAGGRGGFFEQAGQAAQTFDQATAGTRQTIARRQELEMRLKQQQALAEQQFAQRAENELYDRGMKERQYELQRRRVERAEMGDMLGGASLPAGIGSPMGGEGMFAMATKLSEWDPDAYREFDQWFDSITGGRFNSEELTPEILDTLPQKALIRAKLAPLYSHTAKVQDANYIEQGHYQTVLDMERLSPDWMSSTDGQMWALRLDESIARAQRSGSGFTRTDARALYDEARAEAAQEVLTFKSRRKYMGAFDRALDDPKYNDVDEEDLMRAQKIMAGMGTSTSPRTTYIKAMTEIDGDFRAAKAMGYSSGTADGAAGAVAAQVRQQTASAKSYGAADAQESIQSGYFDEQTEPVLERDGSVVVNSIHNTPLLELQIDNMRAADGLSEDDRAMLRALDAAGINRKDEEAVEAFLDDWIAERRSRYQPTAQPPQDPARQQPQPQPSPDPDPVMQLPRARGVASEVQRLPRARGGL